uniref:Partner of bursicon-like isoform X2 n=1 Tax=Dermatophagoides pteronyssinus TaxID=6956 RepID=A0A6P6XW17_DERPT|nr:partner of bursicon-like isoform X2 [Dermatophagoides pteronyssinus]
MLLITKTNPAKMNFTLLFVLFLTSSSLFHFDLVASFISNSELSSQTVDTWQKRNDIDDSSSSSSSIIWLKKCRTMETMIEMSKDEIGSNGELIRRCHGQALVSKCEGACVSNLRPSIQTPTGLLKVLSSKECNCCRETSMQTKRIILDNCFDQDGNELIGEKLIITVNEPRHCACFQCTN